MLSTNEGPSASKSRKPEGNNLEAQATGCRSPGAANHPKHEPYTLSKPYPEPRLGQPKQASAEGFRSQGRFSVYGLGFRD